MLSRTLFSKWLVDISTFKIDDFPIGEGAYGVVRKGIRPASKKKPELTVAVKYLKAERIQTNKDQMKFHNEVGCQASLKHIAVLPLVGYSIPFMGRGDYTIVTEFMPKGSLKSLIEQAASGSAPDNWETIKAINIFGIAAGMAYVHQQKIIHRDLKTENIMLDEDYFPKISDFGFSKVFEEGSENQITQTLNIGTPSYMAPEILDNQHYTNKIDVFAYSIILYELMTNNKPWEDQDNKVKFNLVKYVSEGLRPTIHEREIPPDYVELIERCWDHDPKNRPSFIQMVKGFMDFRDVYFNMELIDETDFLDYIEEAVKGLDFSVLDANDDEEEAHSD